MLIRFFLLLAWLLPFLVSPTNSLFSDLEILSFSFNLNHAQSQLDPEFELIVQKAGVELLVEEQIANGSFEINKQGWGWIGLAEVKPATASWPAPKGEHYLQLGRADQNLRLEKNCISQNLYLDIDSWSQLHFHYAVFSQENNPGFDCPKFIVLINDEIIFLETEATTEWTEAWLDMSQYVQKEVELKICAGNTGDNQKPSWAKLDGLTTSDISLQDSDIVKIKSLSKDNEVGYAYQSEGTEFSETAAEDLVVDLNEFERVNNLEISVQVDDQVTEARTVDVLVDSLPPAEISDLDLIKESDTEISAYFSQDSSSLNLTQFEFKAGATQFSPDSWMEQDSVELAALTLEDYYFFDQFWLPLTADNLSAKTWGAVKVKDAAGNLSDMSNLAQIKQIAGSQTNPIRINEILFNPVGNDYGLWAESEWVELYNSSNQPVDLSDWSIKDEAENVINLTRDNCDTNQDFDDSGELVILPMSYLIVYVNGAPILNNSGDSLTLYDSQEERVDSHQYDGSTSQGETTGRDHVSIETWLTNLDPTPLTPNTSH
jgi:hypothetical protein